MAQNEGRGTTTAQLLLGPCSNERENGLKDRGGKRQGRAVNNSTDSAKDLVSSGTHLSSASQAYDTSVVENMHSNIPARDFTTRSETKEESKQAVGAAVPRTAQLAKCSASSSSRVKALDKESPTIVTPTITMMRQSGTSPSENTTVTNT